MSTLSDYCGSVLRVCSSSNRRQQVRHAESRRHGVSVKRAGGLEASQLSAAAGHDELLLPGGCQLDERSRSPQHHLDHPTFKPNLGRQLQFYSTDNDEEIKPGSKHVEN